jgi:iron complex outermembrane receptor protein
LELLLKYNPKTLLALSIAMAFCSHEAISQELEEKDENIEVIEVKGSFQSALSNAFDEKRLASQVLDSVSAEDLGKLPDVSIAESIARLPGVVANRDRGNATELSVRGLGPNLTNTLLNGREIATGEASRNIRYETYPSELLRGAYVFKSPKASLVEGGIGGSIDLKTIRPLDFNEQRMVVNMRASYFEIADDIENADAVGYTGSFSFVDQFMDNTLGLVLGYSYRKQPTATVSTTIFPSAPRSEFDNANTQAFDNAGIQSLPFGLDAGVRGGDDTRSGLIAAIQWKPSDTLELNADVFQSSVDFLNPSRGIRVEGLNNEFGNLYTNIEGSNGFMTAATIEQTAGFGMSVSTVNEIFTLYDDLIAGGLNLEWNNDSLKIIGDIGYSKNERDARFVSVETEIHDVSGVNPFQVSNGIIANFSSDNSGLSTFGFNVDLSDPSINLPAITRVPDSDTIDDEIYTYALELEYYLEGGFFTSIDLGVRLTNREKSLFARSDFRFTDAGQRVPIPNNLLEASLSGAGSINFPNILTFDRDGVIEQLFGGINPQQASFNTTESWVVTEDIQAAFIAVNFEGELGNFPYKGNVGIRFVDTNTTSSSTFLENGQETNFIEVLTPFTVDNDYTDTLPSLNVAFSLSDTQILRIGASKAISRAPLDDLNAGVGEFNFGSPEAFGGNPSLKPFRANQLDLSYEWYGDSGSVFTVSGFYKDIETFIVRQTLTNTTLPSGAIGNFTQPINGQGGDISGVEVAYSKALDFLPEALKGFGIYLNYSLIDSSIEVGPAFVEGIFPLPGLAENNYNAQLWYFRDGFEARLGYRYNDAYATELGDVPGQILFSDEAAVLDFQASYTFAENNNLEGLKLLFQANNLSDEPFRTYYGTPEVSGRYEEFGRRFWAGFSYEF